MSAPTPAHGQPAAQAAPPHGQLMPRGGGQSWGGAARRSAGGVALLVAGAAAWWWLSTHHISGGGDHSPAEPAPPVQTGAVGGPGQSQIVTLSESAQVAANIGFATVQKLPLRDHLTVPGRIDYDARQPLDYAAPVDGIVSRMLVQVRQKVVAGDPLVELSSPDVGMARDDVRRREDDRLIERKSAEWSTTIADNVESLLETLSTEPPLAQVEQQFQDRVLGNYREKLLGSYSKLLFVEKVNASTRSLSEGGVLSGRIIEERTSNLEVAKANFIAACEEARFMTRQDRERARASLEQADRLVQISREHLRMLVGSRLGNDIPAEKAAADVAAEAAESPGDTSSISSLVLRTPIGGMIEDVFIARGERVRVGDKMFVVADTSTLWVRAQIHEREWTAVEVAEGQQVRVNVPGADSHDTTAVVQHVGAIVEAESRSVPLVAELKNDDAHYKPGMFVWVDLPQGGLKDGLTVPATAVMRHEARAFVFVPQGKGRFRCADVATGVENGPLIEITSGLKEGEEVVSQGAFVLKSELLLDREDRPAE